MISGFFKKVVLHVVGVLLIVFTTSILSVYINTSSFDRRIDEVGRGLSSASGDIQSIIESIERVIEKISKYEKVE